MNNKKKLIIPITLIGLSFAYYIVGFNALNNNQNITKDEKLIGTYIDGQ